jgi:hypothetical protein
MRTNLDELAKSVKKMNVQRDGFRLLREIRLEKERLEKERIKLEELVLLKDSEIESLKKLVKLLN